MLKEDRLMKIFAQNGKIMLTMTRTEWTEMGAKFSKTAADDGWPKKLEKGRFTEYCKRNGFEGPCKACADKAMQSDDSSVRGMASWYLNTVKP